ncbi:unnamed protein product [Rotaria sordida]|uniref:Fibronectin type-III domain-containing protein n=1 Tax=Rotaria sordida TaxID=392033 RepID=A0A814WI64_9BILA|nr:unnamed protein product [Rotaria sordida]CAF1479178.1 unnamed protein product [Rotaria sordida]
MESEYNNQLHFEQKNYFLRFKLNENLNGKFYHINKHIRHALEYFVDDLKHDQNTTIDHFLNQQSVKEIFLCIAQLLLCEDDRICGNCAYIIGSIVEMEKGLKQFLSTFADDYISTIVDIIQILCQMLTHSDSDCVLNATGTLGTISGSKEGRNLILKHICVTQLIFNISTLLNSTNSWIASNAALVFARLTVEEVGCQIILTHNKHNEILNQLLSALDVNDSNRSTNIAFAIARLIERESGKKILINDCGQNKFFEALLIMLEINEDKGINKNACYALSCLCTSQYGFQLCIQSITLFHRILIAIETILLSMEHETVWFALMCLTTIAKHIGAYEHLCYSKKLLGIIKQVQEKWIDFKDIQDESKLLWFMLQKNIKPNRPKIDECRETSVDISWDSYISIDDENKIQYRVILGKILIFFGLSIQIFQFDYLKDDVPIIKTNKTNYSINNLKSNTIYNVKIQYITTQGESIPSDPTVFQTDDELPPPVINLHVVRTTMTAVRIAWESPNLSACNSFKGYQIYLNDIEYEFTDQCEITINSLTINTKYKIDVCAVTMKGKGLCISINVKTDGVGDCLPEPPTFSVIGRRDLHIKWQTPEFISGRLFRYELICNGRCIYSGIELEYHATKLKSNTEYIIELVVITNEGRFRSRPAKIRTLKDEFQSTVRHSLYERPTQSPIKFKRANTVVSRKLSPNMERRITKEMPVINQNVQITTVRSVQLKSDIPSYSRALPGLCRNVQSRPSHSRGLYRSKTDLSLQQITATVIVPTFEINHHPQNNYLKRPKSYRYPLTTKSLEHSPSISLNDSTYGLRRIS